MHGKNVVHMTSGTDKLRFFYDAQNRPAVVVYNGTAYAYVKSLQGDIVAILDENGNTVVSYGYDAWGAPLWCTGELAETLGKVQPFRYRGYVFDEETGLYYLRSRYYNPGWGRFVNADVIISGNLNCYCNNNPINRTDEAGFFPKGSFKFDRHGVEILWHWLYGNGETIVIVDDQKWTDYLNKAPLCTSCNHIDEPVSFEEYMISRYRGMPLTDGVSEPIHEPMAFMNGEGIVGYNYLHGTDETVGGFSYTVNIYMSYGYKVYDFDFVYNDIIDPNYKYDSDREKVEFAKHIPFANPTDYTIQIRWKMRYTECINGTSH